MDSVRLNLPHPPLKGQQHPNKHKTSLQALVAKRDWNEIEEISRQRKSPIGWEVRFPPFPSPP